MFCLGPSLTDLGSSFAEQSGGTGRLTSDDTLATKFWRPAFTAFIIESIQLEEMGYNISVDDKRHTKTNYMKKTGEMDLQK